MNIKKFYFIIKFYFVEKSISMDLISFIVQNKIYKKKYFELADFDFRKKKLF